MFDELAQNEEDAEDYDLESIERRTEALQAARDDDDDAATLVGHRPAEDAVVFEIGDEDAEEHGTEEDAKKRRGTTHDEHEGDEHEREELMKDV